MNRESLQRKPMTGNACSASPLLSLGLVIPLAFVLSGCHSDVTQDLSRSTLSTTILTERTFPISHQSLESANALDQKPFWRHTSGPFGGSISAIYIDSIGDVYIGAQSGNVFRSSDKSKSWTQLGKGNTQQDFQSIVADSEGYIYLAVFDEGIMRFHKTSDSWESKSEGLNISSIESLHILQNDTLFAATADGLFSSSDHADTWTRVIGVKSNSITAVEVYEDEIYVVSGGAMLSRSTDSGASWSEIKVFENISPTAIAVGSEMNLFVGTNTGEVFRADGKEGAWNRVLTFDGTGIAVLEIGPGGDVYAGSHGGNFTDEGMGLYKSTDNGNSWKKVHAKNVARMALTAHDIYLGHSEGVYHSDDGAANWSLNNIGMIAQRVNDIVINKDDVVFAGTYGGVFRSDDDGDSWTEVNTGLTDHGVINMAVNSSGDLFVGTYLSSVFRSTDNGTNWVNASEGIEGGRSGPDNNWIMALEINSRDEIFAATSRHGVFRSSDNGASWSSVSKGLPDEGYRGLVISSDDVIYVGGRTGEVFRSDDRGDSWQELESTNKINDPIVSLVIDSDDVLYAASGDNGVFRYSESRRSWIQTNLGLTVLSARCMAIGSNGILFVGTIGSLPDYSEVNLESIFMSSNQGSSWTLVNSGLNHSKVKALAVNSKGKVFAGTWGGGVYTSVQPISSRERRAE